MPEWKKGHKSEQIRPTKNICAYFSCLFYEGHPISNANISVTLE